MSKWILVVLLSLEVHFAASYLVPLKSEDQAAFGGLLRWFWPWAYGDAGPLGRIGEGNGFPVAGFFLAMAAAGVLILAALAAAGLWVPPDWWPVLASAGAVLLLCLMLLFLGLTKLIPIAVALGTLYVALLRPTVFVTG